MALSLRELHRCTVCAVVFALLLQVQLPCSSALECLCSDCKTPLDKRLATCHTDGACYTTKVSGSTAPVSGCLSNEMSSQLCDQPDSEFKCCYDNHCNVFEDVERELRAVSDGSTNTGHMTMTNDTSDIELRNVAIVTVIVSVVAMTIIISLTTAVVCFVYYRKRKQRLHRRRNASDEIVQSDFRTSTSSYGAPDLCQAFLPQSESISSLLKATVFYGSALSLLVQRSIVQQTVLEKDIEKGRFCDMYIGRWRRERVLVKVYPNKKEKMWFNETEILQLPLMRHENILNFIAADIIQRNSQNYHYLISEHHPRGTLREYLIKTTIEIPAMLCMVKSLINGLAYLHTEVQLQTGVGMTSKPGIAHGNISSQSVYVDKYDSCCLGDLSLSTKDDRHTQLKHTPLGDVRYLPPELLVDQPVQIDFEGLKKADMYSVGLVIWEIAQRSIVQGMVEEFELPYSSMLTSSSMSEETTPTMGEMCAIVCERQERPPTADQWNRDQNTRVIVHTMHECWAHSPSDRPCSHKVKNSLNGQLFLEKRAVTVDKNGQISYKQTSDPVQLYS